MRFKELSPAERVANGIKILDEKLPNWHEKIDVDRLNIMDPCNCVLSQLFGRWDLDNVGVPFGQGYSNGFSDFNWETTLEWKRIIKERLAVQVP